MRKEVIFAVLVGALLGVTLIIGIKRLNTGVSTNPETADHNLGSEEVDQTSPEKIFLAISKPLEKEVLTQSPSIISGVSLANSWIVLISEDEEQITKTDQNGEFNFEKDLTGGINKFRLTAFDGDGNKISKDLTLIFTSQLKNE